MTRTDSTSKPLDWPVVVVGALILLGLGTLIAYFLAGADLSASFGPIDDHEPLYWIGGDGRLSPSEYLSTLLRDTEVGAWPDTVRFRPTYYGFRMGEAVLFGTNVEAWYATVLGLYALTIAMGATAFGIAVDWAADWKSRWARAASFMISGSLAALAVAGMDAWKGIVTRLGPSEILGTAFTMLALLALVLLVRTRTRIWWLPLMAGCIGAPLAKETFILVPFLALATGFYLFTQDKKWSDLLWSASSMIPLALLAPIILGNESDVYGQVGGVERLQIGLTATFAVFRYYWLPGTTALLIASIAWWWLCSRNHRATAMLVGALVAWSVALLWGDIILNGGHYGHVRYWMVFDIAKVLQICGAVILSLAIVRRSAGTPRIVGAIVLLLAAALFGRAILTSLVEFPKIKAEAQLNQVSTKAYESGLSGAVQKLREIGSRQLVVVVPASVEAEPSRAILTQIARSTGGIARGFLLPDMNLEDRQGSTGQWLTALSRQGAENWKLTPFDRFDSNAPVACVFINVDPYPLTPCLANASVRIDARGM